MKEVVKYFFLSKKAIGNGSHSAEANALVSQESILKVCGNTVYTSVVTIIMVVVRSSSFLFFMNTSCSVCTIRNDSAS